MSGGLCHPKNCYPVQVIVGPTLLACIKYLQHTVLVRAWVLCVCSQPEDRPCAQYMYAAMITDHQGNFPVCIHLPSWRQHG